MSVERNVWRMSQSGPIENRSIGVHQARSWRHSGMIFSTSVFQGLMRSRPEHAQCRRIPVPSVPPAAPIHYLVIRRQYASRAASFLLAACSHPSPLSSEFMQVMTPSAATSVCWRLSDGRAILTTCRAKFSCFTCSRLFQSRPVMFLLSAIADDDTRIPIHAAITTASLYIFIPLL
jgi:hypothetical protein